MPNNEEEEPVAYLSGQAAPPAAPPPEEVDGYLGGTAAEEELPALPPVQSYQASDFIAATQEPEPPADYGAPVEAPAQDEGQYDQYAATEAEFQSQAEPSELDQYGQQTAQGYDPAGADTQATPEVQPPGEQSGEFQEPELPKTITQQDAENIIKRITTKKILPPEVAEREGPRVVPATELTPRAQPGLKTFPIILVLMFLAYGGCMAFRDPIARSIENEDLRKLFCAIMFMDDPLAKTNDLPEPPKGPTEEEMRKRDFSQKILQSERRALGLEEPGATPPAPPGGEKKDEPGGEKKGG